MKAFLLTAAVLLACAGSMFAQNLPPDYKWEIGINGGYSAFTRPLGPATAYQGTRTNVSGDFSFRFNYFINPNWMLSLDIGNRRWESYGDWKLNDLNGKTFSTAQQVRFLVADYALTNSVGINYVIPFYTRYNTYNRSNINFGVTFGFINTFNDGSISYAKYKPGPDPSPVYVTGYNYGHGMGITFGAQMGYTYYIFPRLGLNADVAVRYAGVKTNDVRYDHANSSFRVLYFPATMGIRFRF